MYPIATRTAQVLAALALCATLTGLFAQNGALVTVSVAIWLVLAWAFAESIPMGRKLRRERLEFAWWLDHGTGSASGSVVAGVPFLVRCFVRHRGGLDLHVSELTPVASHTLAIDDEEEAAFVFAASARSEFTLKVKAVAAGRVVLHGLAIRLRGPLGLFDTPLYFPNLLTIRVLPRAAALRLHRSGAPLETSASARSGLSRARQRGGGTELRELRELVPGDPFKSIAWKASARRGKLIVREVEQEIQQTRQLIVDVSATMRGGEPGRRKLDYALDLVAAECRRASRDGDRVALTTIDGRVTQHLPAGEGKAQTLRIYDALLAETEVVDADRTATDEHELVRLVTRYVKQQDGVDFAHSTKGKGINRKGLVRHVRRSLGERERKGHAVQAPNTGSRILRIYCQEHGLSLPARSDAPRGKTDALLAAITRAGGRSQVPSTLVVITDFDGVLDSEAFTKTLRVVRAHGHRIEFVLADGRQLDAPSTDPNELAVRSLYARGEERRLRHAHRLLRRHGVMATIASPERI